MEERLLGSQQDEAEDAAGEEERKLQLQAKKLLTKKWTHSCKKDKQMKTSRIKYLNQLKNVYLPVLKRNGQANQNKAFFKSDNI